MGSQNHSCEPNTRYDGLNVIAIRDIAPHEELTLDYSDFWMIRLKHLIVVVIASIVKE